MSQTKTQLISGSASQNVSASTVVLSGATSGTTTLSAPAVAGSNTLTLPTGNGTSGQVLSTNGSGALSWIGAGKILQVVNATTSTSVTNSTSTYVDTNLTATITPTSSSNKILVLVSQTGCGKGGSTYMALRLVRGSTTVLQIEGEGGYTGTTASNSFGACSCCYLDSPATTSATTYKTQVSSVSGVAQVYTQSSGAVSTITLLEVAV